uniref:Uncharacterized protein n=1 Tax=Anguilla anguilla TaxID=7936 RepID=A0A0E9WGR9_ANGAN
MFSTCTVIGQTLFLTYGSKAAVSLGPCHRGRICVSVDTSLEWDSGDLQYVEKIYFCIYFVYGG